MIKESCYLIGQEAQLAKPKQKYQSRSLLSLDDYLHTKNHRYGLVSSRGIDDQKMLQSDWLTGFWAITEEPDFSDAVFAES